MTSWSDVRSFYIADCSLPVKLAPKLTAKHVYMPPFSQMRVRIMYKKLSMFATAYCTCTQNIPNSNLSRHGLHYVIILFQVKLAALVCSQTVYAGMTILASMGTLRTEARMTAQLLKQVNDLFDMLNVRGFGSKVAAPLKVDSHQQLCRMNELKEECQRWRVVGRPRPPCFEGLSQNVNAVLAMHADLVVDGPLSFLMTGRINEDPADNFFSRIRSKGGHRFNPSTEIYVLL